MWQSRSRQEEKAKAYACQVCPNPRPSTYILLDKLSLVNVVLLAGHIATLNKILDFFLIRKKRMDMESNYQWLPHIYKSSL